MDTVNLWLDPAEVRHLAEQLLRPVTSVCQSAHEPDLDSSFIGFTSDDTHLAFNHLSAPIAVPQLVCEPHHVTLQNTRYLQRIQIFRDWLVKNFQAKDIFMLNGTGKVIFDENDHGRLHFMAWNLASASRESGSAHVKIGPEAILEVIFCETTLGRTVLGILLPEALPADHIHTVKEVLKQAISPA